MFDFEELEPAATETAERVATPAVDVPGWALAKLGFAADPAQARAADRIPARDPELHTPVGNSTVTAAKAVHAAITRAESLTVVVSPSARQSGEFVRKAESFVRRRLGMRVRGDGDKRDAARLR
jgi:hypothetical protein